MNDKYKEYDPKEYKQSNIRYTVYIINKEIERLEYSLQLLKKPNSESPNGTSKHIERNLLELRNNRDFLNEYR